MAIYLKKFNNHIGYDSYINDSGAILPNVSICVIEEHVHYNPYVDPCASKKVKTNYEWVEIGGIKWATKNVGAETPTDSGQYFAWGEVDGYFEEQILEEGICQSKNYIAGQYKFYGGGDPTAKTLTVDDLTKYNPTDGKDLLESVDDAATVNMGNGWRTPTDSEWKTLSANTNIVWYENYQNSGSNCLVCTHKTDSSKVLIFPESGYATGQKVVNGHTINTSQGAYLTCYTNSGDYTRVWRAKPRHNLGAQSGDAGYIDVICPNDLLRQTGFSVRGVRVS